MHRIVVEPLDVESAVREVGGAGMGGIAVFLGVVREFNAGRGVVAVEYHAYPAMAEKVMSRIGEALRQDFPGIRVAMLHRIGRLAVGETSLVVAIGAPHRREAFAALRLAVDRIKQSVPVWKKEFYSDGSEWLEPPATGDEASAGDRELPP